MINGRMSTCGYHDNHIIRSIKNYYFVKIHGNKSTNTFKCIETHIQCIRQ